jgi:hypothetical protein
MIGSIDQLHEILRIVFPDSSPPRPLHLVDPIIQVRSGDLTVADAARHAHTTAARIRHLVEPPDPLSALLAGPMPSLEPTEQRVRDTLGQLLIGNVAERVFEEIYRTQVGTTELELRDDRSARGDTDYLVFNGSGRQVFRINIKFHGSLFRRARELVNLDPSDCFALATYKIYAALQKQEAEHLPYIFVIVGVPELTGPVVGSATPSDLVELCALVRVVPTWTGVRTIEDHIVSRLTSDPGAFGFETPAADFTDRIRTADWYVLSARRANELLKARLFERAYALRVRAFARNYRGAELDMHFSLSTDLHPLKEFLQVLHDHGMPGLVSRLERGTI